MKKYKVFIVPITIALVLTLGVLLLKCSLRRQVIITPYAASPTPIPTPTQTTLEGVIVCLEPRNINEPHTDECAVGVKTEDGKYYALDTNLLSSNTTSVLYNTGNTIKAEGTLTPIEYLSTDRWQKYNVQGIFSVSNSLEQVNNTP